MTRTMAGVIQYAKDNPTIHGGSWDGWCEAFVSNAGGFTNSFMTAKSAKEHSHVYPPSKLPISKVPVGWMLHWDFGVDGHIAYKASGGRALMASSYITETIHSHLGYVDAASYEARSGHKYLGASPDHGGQYLQGVPHTPATPSPAISQAKPGKIVYTLSSGNPNIAYWKRLQWYAHLNGYNGVIDGHMGSNSWQGVQKGLRNYKYTGPLDGQPGINTRKALQRMAAKYGYRGPIDGIMGVNTYKGISRRLNLL